MITMMVSKSNNNYINNNKIKNNDNYNSFSYYTLMSIIPIMLMDNNCANYVLWNKHAKSTRSISIFLIIFQINFILRLTSIFVMITMKQFEFEFESCELFQ